MTKKNVYYSFQP